MRIGIAACGDYRYRSFIIDTKKSVWAGNGLQRINSNGKAAIGAVFKTDRA